MTDVATSPARAVDQDGWDGPHRAWLLPAGLVIAFLGSVCGIGGGLFAVPLLHFVFRRPMRLAVGTSLYLVLVVTATSTLTEVLHSESTLRPELVGLMAIGALFGNQVGYALSKRIPQRVLRLIFVVVLSIAAWRVFAQASGTGNELALGEDLELDAAKIALVLAIGFGGGVLAPLLGIGGGLLMVPALFLLMPEIGFLGARAQSMAVGSVNAARSVFFYQRENAIDGVGAAWFSAGALVGAVLGVLFVHQPGWADPARLAMGGILVLVALRFALAGSGSDD